MRVISKQPFILKLETEVSKDFSATLDPACVNDRNLQNWFLLDVLATYRYLQPRKKSSKIGIQIYPPVNSGLHLYPTIL